MFVVFSKKILKSFINKIGCERLKFPGYSSKINEVNRSYRIIISYFNSDNNDIIPNIIYLNESKFV